MPFEIVYGDITQMTTDAIVNAANTSLDEGAGVCGAIFAAAGSSKLTAACRPLAPIATGEAVITPGFNLSARYIIHTAGPMFEYGDEKGPAALRNCYLNSMMLAMTHNCNSVSFPLISSGIYGFPKALATIIATEAIQDFLEEHELLVYLVLFGKS